jgi:hypothetical protein
MGTERPLCPYCSAPMVDAGDIPTFETEEIATGLSGKKNVPLSFWVVSCGKCRKLLGILPHESARIRFVRRLLEQQVG